MFLTPNLIQLFFSESEPSKHRVKVLGRRTTQFIFKNASDKKDLRNLKRLLDSLRRFSGLIFDQQSLNLGNIQKVGNIQLASLVL